MKYFAVTFLLAVLCFSVIAQRPSPSANGRFYGKVLDAETGKGIEFATVRLFSAGDTAASPALVTGVITQANGEFSLDGIPVGSPYTLVITAIGFTEYRQQVSFTGAPEKDLGNIRLKVDVVTLEAVEIEGTGPSVRLEADKKVFEMSDNAVSAGGTAEDVLKQVPSVSVDMEGNVTLRNNSPQIFVDGRLTTLTIDQIPADAIESIEVITNPSAKYDASGGTGGIINIVLKKERKLGYHGNVRAGVDMRGKINAGGNINVREGKVNAFVMGNLFQRKSIGTTETVRSENYGSPMLNYNQQSASEMERQFMFGRAGIDYFINNRSTITLSHTYNQGDFTPFEVMNTETDTVYDNFVRTGSLQRTSLTERGFFNHSSSVLFKHLFPQEGRELTADATLNQSGGYGDGTFTTIRQGVNGNDPLFTTRQKQVSEGENDFLTVQADYVTPTPRKGKIEAGVRAAIREFTSLNSSYIFDKAAEEYILLEDLTGNYGYTDHVYAAYITKSRSFEKSGYQVGLRAESSFYEGTLLNTGETFKNYYPVSLFPSASGFYKISKSSEIQVNATRRVNRPNFFSLMPFTDFSDSLDIRRGNPGLKPEFSHIGEINFLHTYKKENTFMVTGFFRYVNNLFTNYQLLETNPVTGNETIINTTINADGAYGYGVEVTSRTVTKKILDVTANAAVYNAVIEGATTIPGTNWAWYGEVNANVKLPKGFIFQTSVEYESRTVYEVNNNRGGRDWGSQASGNAQGYSFPEFEVDMAIRKDFFKRKLIASLSVSDVFKTEIHGSYVETPFFTQETIRRRDQQFIRFNLSYTFGKFDQSLFRRKNTRDTMDTEGGF